MARIENTVFISYRRTDVYTALAVYENLKNQGYDVFFDYRSISSGDFSQIITANIKARAHFLLILTPTTLDRCNEPGDWLRREIELAIDEKRNIVPLFFKGFRFGAPNVRDKLTGTMQHLNRYNGLNVHEDYFDEAMQRLRSQYLNIPLDTILHPVSNEVQKVVVAEQVAADQALEQIEDVQQLVKQSDDKPVQLPVPEPMPKLDPEPVTNLPEKQVETVSIPVADAPVQLDTIQTKPDETPQKKTSARKPVSKKAKPEKDIPQSQITPKISASNWNFRLIGGIAGGILALALIIWGGFSIGLGGGAASAPTRTPQPAFTNTSKPVVTSTVFATGTSVPPTPTLSIINSTVSEKDGMTLLYVPAGEFMMGSDDGQVDESPVHTVYLDAFWIDKTEVANSMYAKCVRDSKCNLPSSSTSYTRDSYYGDSEFDSFPVIYVSWDDAVNYCSWAGRRLPTEAEWEKAARGTDARVYPWGDNITCSYANYWGKRNGCAGDTTEVGKYPNGASPYGALDMAGNVWEWVSDWYSKTYYDSSPVSNPLGPETGEYRFLRGGSWEFDDYFLRSAYRDRYIPGLKYNNVGFRCAMDATP